ncbi:MAG: glycosyl hydrolase family 28 protein [Ginsengibacter sp.]
MIIKKYILLIFISLLTLPVLAEDYKASLFGINSDGVTLNTRSIQYAIDFIHERGGGRLVFYVGRYVTGSIYLKSNVTIRLEEGAVLVGSLNPFDYDKNIWTALIFAKDQTNVGITGKGIIDGRGQQVALNVVTNIEKGLLKDSYKYGRPSAENRPVNIYFRNCQNIVIRGITLRNSASWNQNYDQCKNLLVDSVTVDNTVYWNEDGVDILNCENVVVSNCYIDAADDGICLKSFDSTKICKNVLIHNNKIRTSANGIKFGTASLGGFEDVRIINNVVFNTYRSAVALEAVDGGYIKNIEIDSLQSIHTGNVIFLRIGERWVPGKIGHFENVKISNVTGDIPATKPDAGYGYEGPEEDQPRNISPGIIIAGLPGSPITDISFKNIQFTHPGGGQANYANIPLDKLNAIPELPANYPEFSMFKELPAWGIFARHATGLKFLNITMECERKDFRIPIVLDDVSQCSFSELKISQLGKEKKKYIYQNNCKGISVK